LHQRARFTRDRNRDPHAFALQLFKLLLNLIHLRLLFRVAGTVLGKEAEQRQWERSRGLSALNEVTANSLTLDTPGATGVFSRRGQREPATERPIGKPLPAPAQTGTERVQRPPRTVQTIERLTRTPAAPGHSSKFRNISFTSPRTWFLTWPTLHHADDREPRIRFICPRKPFSAASSITLSVTIIEVIICGHPVRSAGASALISSAPLCAAFREIGNGRQLSRFSQLCRMS